MTFLLAQLLFVIQIWMIIFVPLAKLFPVIARPCIGLLCWLDSSMGLCFTQSLFVHVWMIIPQVSSRFKLQMDVPLVYSLLFYFSFKESLWTIHPCVQGFYSSMLVCLSWITLNECTKMKDFHTIMYILENTSYIYIYINPNLCKHSSTGMAHAREGIKNTHKCVHEQHKSENTNVLSRGLLKYLKHIVVVNKQT